MVSARLGDKPFKMTETNVLEYYVLCAYLHN